MKILMREDNRKRITRFQEVLAEWPACGLKVWRDAHSMIQALDHELNGTTLVCLDHDLIPDPGDPDPGDGLMVAEAIASLTPVCDIAIHSTNVHRVQSMIRELNDGGWNTHRIAPSGMGEDWITSIWLPKIKRILR